MAMHIEWYPGSGGSDVGPGAWWGWWHVAVVTWWRWRQWWQWRREWRWEVHYSYESGPTRDDVGDVRPAVARLLVRRDEQRLLRLGPRAALDVRAQVVVPPLAALLADAPVQHPRDRAPLARAVLIHQPAQGEGGQGIAQYRSRRMHASNCKLLCAPCALLKSEN